MTAAGQGLLKRHTQYTQEQFSEHWLRHAAKVVPWALENGITYYAQIHQPRIASGVEAPADLDISEWDGAAEMSFDRPPGFQSTAKSTDYYQRVILPDERAFLLSEALQHIRRVENGTVVGDKVVIIQDGKPQIKCDQEATVWREWQLKSAESSAE